MSAPVTLTSPFWTSWVPGPITHSPHRAFAPGATLACANAATSTDEFPKTLPNGVLTVRVGITTRTSVGHGIPLKEMQGVWPVTVVNPEGRFASVQAAHSPLVVPKLSSADCLAAVIAAVVFVAPVR